MTLTIHINPELEAELNRQAAAHGVEIGAYAASLLEAATNGSATSKIVSRSQLENTLRELSQFSHKTPLLPDESFSREGLYQGHV